MKPIILVVSYIGVTLLPLMLAWSGFRPPRSVSDELASGAGMLAFSIILTEFVLSGRFRSISGKVGMDVTMRVHQLLARSALVLALVHPFLYRALFSEQRPWDVTRQLTLATDLNALGTGILAWVLLPAFVVLAVYHDKLGYKYETWRLMHGVGAVLIAGLILHHTLNAGRYSQDPVLAGLWITMSVVAFASLAFVYFVEPLQQRRTAWEVVSVKPLALKTWELTLEPLNHSGLTYQAGQFAWLNIGNSAFSLRENPFSISSAPGDGKALQFVIKELGDFTSRIGEVTKGTRTFVDGPHGNLVVSDRTENGIVLIAGGVGIAPLLGILRQLHHDGDHRPILLIYGNRIEDQIIYREQLDRLEKEMNKEVVYVLSDPPDDWSGETGLINAEIIRKYLNGRDMLERLYILCGPTGMLEAMESELVNLGVPAHQILAERFSYD